MTADERTLHQEIGQLRASKAILIGALERIAKFEPRDVLDPARCFEAYARATAQFVLGWEKPSLMREPF